MCCVVYIGADVDATTVLSEEDGEDSIDSGPIQSELVVGKVPGDGDLGGKLSVFLHRRDDQKSTDIIKPLVK